MNTWFERPSQMGLIGAFVQCAIAASLSFAVWTIDPRFESKIHGPLLTLLASVFLIQDALVGTFRKSKEEARKLNGLKSTSLRGHFEKLSRLSERAEQTWWVATFLRVMTIIAGVSLTYGSLGFRMRTIAVLGGY